MKGSGPSEAARERRAAGLHPPIRQSSMASKSTGMKVLVVALLAALAFQSAAALQLEQPLRMVKAARAGAPVPAGAARKLMRASGGGCSWQGHQYNDGAWCSGFQCCGGSWSKTGCGGGGDYGASAGSSSTGGGGCSWQGQQTNNGGWNSGWQCCSGSWSKGGCSR